MEQKRFTFKRSNKDCDEADQPFSTPTLRARTLLPIPFCYKESVRRIHVRK
ncbi:12993_t:CDS:1, partial [Acaulospora colombiana]